MIPARDGGMAAAPARQTARRRQRGARAEKWGRAAEVQAAAAYAARGAVVVEARARTAGGEIDLVVREGDTLVFVEVRARATHAAALESVDASKRARFAQAVEAYLADAPVDPDQNIRLDVAALDRAGAVALVENVSLM